MIRKGKISSKSDDGSKASIIFPDLDSNVSIELPIIKIPIVDMSVSISGATITGIAGLVAIAGKLTGTITMKFSIGDVVLVCFWGNSLSDGAILGKVN